MDTSGQERRGGSSPGFVADPLLCRAHRVPRPGSAGIWVASGMLFFGEPPTPKLEVVQPEIKRTSQ